MSLDPPLIILKPSARTPASILTPSNDKGTSPEDVKRHDFRHHLEYEALLILAVLSMVQGLACGVLGLREYEARLILTVLDGEVLFTQPPKQRPYDSYKL